MECTLEAMDVPVICHVLYEKAHEFINVLEARAPLLALFWKSLSSQTVQTHFLDLVDPMVVMAVDSRSRSGSGVLRNLTMKINAVMFLTGSSPVVVHTWSHSNSDDTASEWMGPPGEPNRAALAVLTTRAESTAPLVDLRRIFTWVTTSCERRACTGAEADQLATTTVHEQGRKGDKDRGQKVDPHHVRRRDGLVTAYAVGEKNAVKFLLGSGVRFIGTLPLLLPNRRFH